MNYLGAIPAGVVLPIFFDSYAGSTGASVTITGLAVTDIEIYKGVSMTQRSSDNGYTLLDTDGIDLDGITGIHGFSIDLGDNSDAGFYAAGSFYNVVVSAITVDSQTVNFVAATFRIVAAEGTAGTPVADATRWNNLATVALPLVPTTAGRTLDVAATGEAGLDFNNILSTGLATLHSLTITNGFTVSGNVLVSGTWTTTGATTYTGTVGYSNGISVIGGTNTDALLLSAAAGGSGLKTQGNTTGHGINAIAGTTGHGMKLLGGATSGDGLNTAGNGAGDGIEAVGTGGNVDIRAAITGNITGNLSGSVGSVTGSVAGSVGSVTGNVGGNVVGSVASVTGNVGGNVVGSVASVVAAVAITSNVKKNQALNKFEFLMTDSTTHSPQTLLTVTVTRSIDNGAFGAGTLSAVTEIGNGIYSVDFGAGDLNGNVITLQATALLADTTFERIVTQP